MKIADLLRASEPCFSFEFFAPQTDAGMENLLTRVRALRALNPAFVSVTYGAGGSGRARAIELDKRIKHELELEVLAHVTCVGHTRDELRAIFSDLASAGIENVLALRGDAPRGEAAFAAPAGGFRYASELLEFLSAEFGFGLGAAAYPETHPEAVSAEADMASALAKVRAGARFLITQLFFDNDYYFGYVERARAAGIDVPILPGIMPLTSFEQIARITKMCGATIPQALLTELEFRLEEPEATLDLGVAYSTLQCADLLARGAPGIHFYTLNRSPATRAVVSALQAARASWAAAARQRAGSEAVTTAP
jgi:methylenetetrahydrofolate reductase (NADPH)